VIAAFTGPSRLTDCESRWALDQIRGLPWAEVARSGCADGLDTLVAYHKASATTELYVPAGRHNERLVELARPARGFRIIECPASAEPYRIRNEWLLMGEPVPAPTFLARAWADVLHAFLRRPDFYRSGEWMTVNIARRLGIEVVKHLIPQS
jgi:hypothetical protein